VRGAIIPDPEWELANLAVVCNLWGLVTPAGKKVREIRCHRLIARQLTAVFDALQAQGLLSVVKTYDGCYVPRHKLHNPAKGLSPHAWGVAVDLNAAEYPYGSTRLQDSRLVAAFEAEGFEWGGRWRSPDPMHFEAVEVRSQC
jgi:hypothetical protein